MRHLDFEQAEEALSEIYKIAERYQKEEYAERLRDCKCLEGTYKLMGEQDHKLPKKARSVAKATISDLIYKLERIEESMDTPRVGR